LRASDRAAAPARGFVAGALCVAWLAACGGPQHQPDGSGGRGAVRDPAPPAYMGTPIEQRRDAACDQLGPKLTACAVEDARASLAAGKIDKAQFDKDTAPAVQRRHTEKFETACKAKPYSSRQVRVLEVCLREETRCGPLLECLGHLSDAAPARPHELR
jgi:hypothetical protein